MTGPGVSAEYEVTALRYGTRTARRSEVFLHFEVYREPDREFAFWSSPLSRKPLFMRRYPAVAGAATLAVRVG